MAVLTSRQNLIDYCLRQLGDPVIEINVDDDQVEDRVDDALQVYQEFHGDATLRTYLKHQVTDSDVANGYIPVSDSIIFVSHLFPIDTAFSSSQNMFSFKYQMMLNDMTGLATWSGDMAYYEQMNQYLSLLDMKLNGTPQISFARRQNRLYIWGDFADEDIQSGDYVVAEVYQIIDPDTHTSIWNDMFLKDYTTALIKKQWGQNMSKFDGVQLPGGVTINGRQLLEDANQEIETLRERLRLEQELPLDFYVG